MNEMIERIKTAMRATGCDCEQWDDAPLTEIARAAVTAMREPTERMLEADLRASRALKAPHTLRAQQLACWQAAIDEALK